jgi:putative phosphoesterase
VKLGLISDTHLPALGVTPPPEVARAFAGVDMILHAGDIYSSDCLDWLEQIAPVIAVEVPPAPVVGDHRVVAGALGRVVELEGHIIGLVHDLAIRGIDEVLPGALGAKYPADRSLAGALADFFGRPVDAVVFGHTHHAMAESHQGIWFVNPGSPTLPRQVRALGQVGILELGTAGARSGHIIELSKLP